MDNLLAHIQQETAAFEIQLDAFQQRIETDYYAPALALEGAVELNVISPGERLAKVTAAALDARLEHFEIDADALLVEAESHVQSRADALNAAGDALQLAANLLESNVKSMEQSLDAG